jgi:alpha-galactosidase
MVLLLAVVSAASVAPAQERWLIDLPTSQSGQHPMAAHSEAHCAPATRAAVAAPLRRTPANKEFPNERDWRAAGPIVFCHDWKGEIPLPQRETEVRLLWSSQFLYVRFRAHYGELFLYPEENVRREQLWQRDVGEIFAQADTKVLKQYQEFEVSPNGDWLDLDIAPEGASNPMCPLATRATIDPEQQVWTAELAIPVKCITPSFDPDAVWRLNLFRIEGREPERFYSAWLPTNTSKPNFHVPEAFGTLSFARK